MSAATPSLSEMTRWALLPRPSSTNCRTRMSTPPRFPFVPPPLLKAGRAIGPGHEVRDLRWRGEFRVLALQVRFQHPTGAGASGSNVYSNSASDGLRQNLLERRPAEWHQILRNDAA